MRQTNCKQCGKELIPNGRGRPRQFCDDQCRRRYHGTSPCEQCGTPSWNKLCTKCANAEIIFNKQHQSALFWNDILDLRAEGLLNYEIGIRLKRNQVAIASAVTRMRAAGIKVPKSTYERAKWMENWYRLRAARGDIGRPRVTDKKKRNRRKPKSLRQHSRRSS